MCKCGYCKECRAYKYKKKKYKSGKLKFKNREIAGLSGLFQNIKRFGNRK